MKRFFFYFFVAIVPNIYGNVTINDWKGFPMTDSKLQIPLDLTYTKREFESISQGLIPKDMDDRWVILVENGHIFFWRSWTGTMIYDCSYEKKEDGIYISSVHVNRNINEYKNTDDEVDVLTVKSWLNRLASQNP